LGLGGKPKLLGRAVAVCTVLKFTVI
jgi:hypothetical protein